MRVLVTGAAGFLGRASVRALTNAGHRVRAATRSPGSVQWAEETVSCDVTDAVSVGRAVDGVDAVCHLAALTRSRESVAAPETYWRVNAGGTLTVLEAATAESRRRADVLSVLVMSTGTVYGAPARQPIAETCLPDPASPYASSKLAADLAVRDVAGAGRIGAVSLRAMNVAGPGDGDMSRVVPQVVAAAPALAVNGDGSAVREYVHVADVADALVRALAACEPGGWRAYNVGSGVGSSVLDVVAAAERVTGVPVAVEHRPAVMEPPVLISDSSRIRSELGWSPIRSDLDTIVRDAWRARIDAESA